LVNKQNKSKKTVEQKIPTRKMAISAALPLEATRPASRSRP